MARCTQCGIPAFYKVNAHLLCIACMWKLKEIERIDHNMAANRYNVAAADMEAAMPIYMPIERMRHVAAAPRGGTVSLQNINVHSSTIGVLNTGFIQELDNSMTVLKDAPSKEIYEQLKGFSQALVDDQTLPVDKKNEALEHLAVVSSEVAAPAASRKKHVALTSLKAVGEVIVVSASASALWQNLHPLLLAHFH